MTLQDWFRAAEVGDLDYIKEKLVDFKGKTTGRGLTALMLAVRNHNPQIVTVLAPLEQGAYDSDGNTALSMAAAADDEDSCAILLQWEKDLSLPGGMNPLLICVKHGGIRALSLLLKTYEQGCDALGRTLLEYSVLSKSPGTICTVLEYTKPSMVQLADTITKIFSDQDVALAELQDAKLHLTEENRMMDRQLKETETALETANLESHNLRCKIRSMEDYTDGIHDILRQVTHMESIDDILNCLIDPAFNAEISKYLESNKIASTTSVSTSPFNNILSCSSAELRNDQPDAQFMKELESLREQLASKDKEIALLRTRLTPLDATYSTHELSEYDLLVIESYKQQISDQNVRLEKQAEELHALRHLVRSMAIESIADSPESASAVTIEQQTLLELAKEERLTALQRLKATSEGDTLSTIQERSIRNDSQQFNYSFANDSVSDKDVIGMYQVMKDLLEMDSSTPALQDDMCDTETLSTVRIFTETDTVSDFAATWTPVKFDDFRAVFEQLIKRFIDMQKEKNMLIDKQTVYRPDVSRSTKDVYSEGWQVVHDSADNLRDDCQSVSHRDEGSTELTSEAVTMVQPTRNKSPPQLLSSSGNYQKERSQELYQQSAAPESSAKEDTVSTSIMTDEATHFKLGLPLQTPLRTINVQQENEELLRYMATSDAPSTSEKAHQNRDLDLERIYSTLNGQDWSATRTYPAETTVVSAVFSSRGVKIKTSKGRSL
ncbi:Protein 21.1 [Giardia duodenalis assemblage B]|uniref:Protein 21.1 n=1 Tax=Giardia duodenalis assemblage B TaxID=1394984 RepID=A0A132NZ52_GIAIN|nr:Protein 21.1 [Giardia intestinalis assemblage B]